MGRMGEKVQRIRSIIGGHKIDRGRLRIALEMEKSKNLYIQPVDVNKWGGMLEGGRLQDRGGYRGEKLGQL